MTLPDNAVLLMEGSDYETFPAGGQLTMSRSLMKLFGNRLALVGMTRGEDPIGQWTKKQISGVPYWFFPVSSKKPSARKPFVPARLEFYLALKRYRREILSLGSKSAFTQCPEALLGIAVELGQPLLLVPGRGKPAEGLALSICQAPVPVVR